MANQSPASADNSSEVTRSLAEWTHNWSTDDVDSEVRQAARHCLLDWMGVTLGGIDDESASIARAEVLEQGGADHATIVGTPYRTGIMNAALANGTAGHALDFDDVHDWLTGHPTVVSMTALLALAEREGFSGRHLIDAFIAAVEVACRVGRYVAPSHYATGWHATATVGAIGAAAGAARAVGLDADGVARAMGLAASQAGGLKSMFGTMCKPLHAGKAASNALLAVQLARRGFSARTDILECEQGFNAAFSGGGNSGLALEGLGRPRAVRDVLFKYHAACFGTHAAMDAIAQVRDAQNVSTDEVERVELHVPASNLAMCNIPEPQTGLEAKFSMRFTAAMSFAGVPTGDADIYNEQTCSREDLVALRDRVSVNGDSDLGKFEAEAVVHLRNGVVHRAHADAGIPESDLARQERRLSEKFMLLAAPVLGEKGAAKLAELSLGADSGVSVQTVMRAAVPDTV